MDELILKERETREKVVELINNSGLPAVMLKPIFKEMYDQISNIEVQQYNQALANKEEKEKKSKKGGKVNE